MAEDYYYNSPYAFSENKVTNHIELEGLEAVSAQSVANEVAGNLEDMFNTIVDAVSSTVDAVVDAITPEKIQVTEAAPTAKAESGIEDGIIVVKDGDQPDNAPKGNGTVVKEPDSPVGVKKPNVLSRTQATLGSFLDGIVDVVKQTHEPIPGDSGKYRAFNYKIGKDETRIGVKLTNSKGISPKGSRTAKDKSDSTKYEIN